MADLPTLSIQIEPLGDHIAVIPDSMERVTASGIVIPDTVKDEKSTIGTVIAVGKGGMGADSINPGEHVKAGDKVMFGQYSGEDLEVQDKDGNDVKLKLLEMRSVRAIVR